MRSFFSTFFRSTSEPPNLFNLSERSSSSYLEHVLKNSLVLPKSSVGEICENFTRQCFVFATAKNVDEVCSYFQINILLSWSKTSSLVPVGLVCILISVFFQTPGTRLQWNSEVKTIFDFCVFSPGWTLSAKKIETLSAKHDCSNEIVLNSLVRYRSGVQKSSTKTGQFFLQLAFLKQAIVLVFPFFCLVYDFFMLSLNFLSPQLAETCQKDPNFRVLCGLFYTRAFFSVSGLIVKWFIVSLTRLVYK